MYTFILLSFVTLSQALRRAAMHTQELDHITAVDTWRHRLLADIHTNGSSAVENVPNMQNIEHTDSFDSAFDEITQRGTGYPGKSRRAEDVAHELDLAFMTATSKLAVKNVPETGKATVVHKANASALVAKSVHLDDEAGAAHKGQQEAQMNMAAHKASSRLAVKKLLADGARSFETASEFVTKASHLAHQMEGTDKATPADRMRKAFASQKEAPPSGDEPKGAAKAPALAAPSSGNEPAGAATALPSGDEPKVAASHNTDEISWDRKVDARNPMPSQGFVGDPVLHKDQRTMISDWQLEHSVTHGLTDRQKICDICRSHPNNEWCHGKCPELFKADAIPLPEVFSPESQAGAGKLKSAAEPKSIAQSVLLCVIFFAGMA